MVLASTIMPSPESAVVSPPLTDRHSDQVPSSFLAPPPAARACSGLRQVHATSTAPARNGTSKYRGTMVCLRNEYCRLATRLFFHDRGRVIDVRHLVIQPSGLRAI